VQARAQGDGSNFVQLERGIVEASELRAACEAVGYNIEVTSFEEDRVEMVSSRIVEFLSIPLTFGDARLFDMARMRRI
jgi:hypothetical protein